MEVFRRIPRSRFDEYSNIHELPSLRLCNSEGKALYTLASPQPNFCRLTCNTRITHHSRREDL
jgi:hypothetical protein